MRARLLKISASTIRRGRDHQVVSADVLSTRKKMSPEPSMDAGFRQAEGSHRYLADHPFHEPFPFRLARHSVGAVNAVEQFGGRHGRYRDRLLSERRQSGVQVELLPLGLDQNRAVEHHSHGDSRGRDPRTPSEAADGFYGGGYPAFNGLYLSSNQITLDGTNNQSYMTRRPAVPLTPETVQEFKVVTNNYSAEYGRVGGAVISMLSKSGSNELHGHGWYYIRDERFDAANFFTNKLGGNQLPVDYQIFGGSVGGPIIKDRTFFHTHYERFIDNLELPAFLTVPSQNLRDGDFSGSGPSGPIPQLYNPFDVVDGQRLPFADNRIPRSLWSPVYSKMMELMAPPPPKRLRSDIRQLQLPQHQARPCQ